MDINKKITDVYSVKNIVNSLIISAGGVEKIINKKIEKNMNVVFVVNSIICNDPFHISASSLMRDSEKLPPILNKRLFYNSNKIEEKKMWYVNASIELYMDIVHEYDEDRDIPKFKILSLDMDVIIKYKDESKITKKMFYEKDLLKLIPKIK